MRTVAFWASLILIFVIPWEAIIMFPGLGTVSRMIGLAVAAFWLLTVAVTGGFRKPRAFHAVFGLFVLWNVLSVFWSVDVAHTVINIRTYLQLALFVLLLWDLYTTPAAVKAGLQAYVFGAYVAIGSLVANYLSGSQATYARYAAQGYNPNTIALVLALGVPAAFYLAASGGNSKKAQVLRLVNYAYVPAAIFAIALTGTRFALLATLPAFIFGIGSLGRLKPLSRVLILVVVVGAFIALPSLIPQSSLQRLASTYAELSGGDLSGRVEIWRDGLAVLADHPLLGVGSAAFPSAIASGRSAHNTFLLVFTELGIIGFTLFAIMLAMAFYDSIRQAKWDSGFSLTLLLVWVLGASALSWVTAKPTWLFLCLIIAGANLATQSVRAGQRSGFSAASLGSAKERSVSPEPRLATQWRHR
jgi:O-antigen ligase